jgi:chromatin assembly factor 1 subunit B
MKHTHTCILENADIYAALERGEQRRGAEGDISFDSRQAHTSCQCREMVSTWYVDLTATIWIVLTFAGEMLATAGDDGNVLLWVPAENQTTHNFEEGLEDKETWRVKTMCRSNTSEIYDLAWSPDGVFFITGSMDNIARIYNAQTGTSQCSIRLLRSYSTFSR